MIGIVSALVLALGLAACTDDADDPADPTTEQQAEPADKPPLERAEPVKQTLKPQGNSGVNPLY